MLVIKYSAFAIISTLLNLIIQYISSESYTGFASLYVAMFFGTMAGLIAKYILDKKFIFYHTPINKRDDVRKFAIYSVMGGFTTIIFWGTEIAFDTLWNDHNAKYFGAALGLSIGYMIKYFLDRKFVFVHRGNLA